MQNPPDPLFGLTERFKKDPFDKKVNLGIGAYRTDDNRPFLLPTVHLAETQMANEALDHEYASESTNMENPNRRTMNDFGTKAFLA